MKFAIVLFAALFAVSTASQVTKAELEKGFTDFLAGLVQQVILPPLTTTIQTSAELLAQLTAGVGKQGKRRLISNSFYVISLISFQLLVVLTL